MRWGREIAVGLASVVLAGAALAAPKEGARVLSFHADVTVAADASVVVEETIRVRSTRRAIDHGIYRSFATHVSAPAKPFEVLAVSRDGRSEPYELEVQGGVTRVRVGARDVRLRPGGHTYVLAYRTDRQLYHLANRDQLDWDVTGNEWALPIDEASAAVHLPPGAAERADPPEGTTGVVGAKARDLVATRSRDGATFRTTRPLAPGEGLAILLAWPKGFVWAPAATRARTSAPACNPGPQTPAVYRTRRIMLAIFVGVVFLTVFFMSRAFWPSSSYDRDDWLYRDSWRDRDASGGGSTSGGDSTSGGTGMSGGGGW